MSQMCFLNQDGIKVVKNVISSIQANREYLSELDGAAGDGDHGINMSKGFTFAEEEIASKESVSMSEGFLMISNILIQKIGGSMGPLYGSFFRGLSVASKKQDTIDKNTMLAMLEKAYSNLTALTDAKVGDKTLIDVLNPAVSAFKSAVEEDAIFSVCLEKMLAEAERGLESTKNMVAKYGRSSRLGERSIGHQDAGATSCFLILKAIAQAEMELITD